MMAFNRGNGFVGIIQGLVISSTCLSNLTFAETHSSSGLLDLQLEELLNISVTSASKKSEPLSSVASAVYVITDEDIHRSGVTNIPDALRMVPGIQVARIDSNKWAVTSRGFNGHYANKLLVMVDGRTVYSPSYSGVYWEMQDLFLEDIERIEVIRGPGGSVWGANAVNGVINIISKHAADTQDDIVVAAAGDFEKAYAGVRMGGKIGEQTYARGYVKTNQRGDTTRLDGSSSYDAWQSSRIGGRIDLFASAVDRLTLMADYQRADIDSEMSYATFTAPYTAIERDNYEYSSWNVSTRWDRVVSSSNEWSLQVYFDNLDRADFLLDENRDTLDVDFTHHLQFSDQQELTWGLGYRYLSDRLVSGEIVRVYPERRRNELYSAFVQDQLALVNDIDLILGLKWENNEYTGDEFQPSIKLSWKMSDDDHLWVSIAKAVRTPAVGETDLELRAVTIPGSPPIVSSAVPSDCLEAEKVVAYELGWRSLLTGQLSMDAVLFYNDYSDLRSFSYTPIELRSTPVPHLFQGAEFVNAASGNNHGLELAANWMPSMSTSLNFAYTYIETDIEWPNIFDIHQNTPAPRHQLSMQFHYQFTPEFEANFWLRYVHDTKVIHQFVVDELDAYTTADLNLMWKVTPSVELQLVGQNLLDSSHQEYVQELLVLPAEVDRSVYGKVTLHF